ncbi:bleomycin hydrolase SCDLUD_003041 [Saccharomycodes ludwigii]|uniref:bleomycin hydrolase n=1 Tax=Saccharomycodes ludwigii TaxID=36035 RepID=UPI001E83B460|nr:hypothetical protein SCDLUD_003041 [Saccharomycodes ludwigii]KAH3901544.1 hypothetical protein SCDLUD_003041 [Saccharomycodes ludwigii]
MPSLSIEELSKWDEEFFTDLTHCLASTVLKNYNADDALLDKTQLLKHYPRVYNTTVEIDGAPITNQKSSGRCWLFAATNQLRLNAMEKLSLKELELSQSYVFFYDKLEKCNYFLEQIIDTRDQKVDSRLVQYLLEAPTNDGGQYSMFINIVKKYGLVPKDLYGDLPYSTTASRKLNQLLTTKLREFAEVLREEPEVGNLPILQKKFQKQIFKILTTFMDAPSSIVKPNEEFSWEYLDKDKNLKSLKCTPLEFATNICGLDLEQPPVSLINDPRHPYGELIEIDRLGNVTGGDAVLYLNVDNDTLTELVVKRLKNNKAVFFGSHTPRYMDKKNGIMDVDLWNYKAIGYQCNQSKASRIKYHESLMTHAMLITGCHLSENGKPVRYRVENSWGKDSGKDGLYLMTQKYFEEYAFQIVVDLDELPENLKEKFTDKESLSSATKIILPIWDPMGALAI